MILFQGYTALHLAVIQGRENVIASLFDSGKKTLALASCLLIFSRLLSLLYFSYDTEKESLFDNQELLNVVIISSILITFSFDSRVKCKEKIEASHSWG